MAFLNDILYYNELNRKTGDSSWSNFRKRDDQIKE